MPFEETLRRYPPEAVDYARELFEQHWSEAAWLYMRREVLDIQGKLLSLDQWLEIEARARAHIVALCRGGRLVSDECEARARDGDVGELHTAVRVLCRSDHPGRLNALINALNWQHPARASAVADALAWDAPEPWQELVAAVLEDEAAPEDALGPLARVVGLRGWPLGDLLVGVLEDRVGDLVATADAVAWLQVAEALPSLSELVTNAREPRVRQAAAIAALSFDARGVVAYLGQIVGSEPWAAVPLAMAAGAEAFPVLAAALERSPGAREIILGLGLLGRVDGVPLLLEALADPSVAPVAAEALYLLTGAELHENTTLMEEDEDAEPGVGLVVVRLSSSRERWAAWLEEHAGAWSGQPAQRLRFGVPFEACRVLDELGRTTLRPELRETMAAELSIRYRIQRRYSSRMLVSEQRKALARLRAELEGRPRIDAGEWVVDGVALRSPGGRMRRP